MRGIISRILVIASGVALIVAFVVPWFDVMGFIWQAAGAPPELSELGQGDSYFVRSAYELVRDDGIYRLVLPPLAGLALLLYACTRGSRYAVVAIVVGTGLLLWWLVDPFFGALVAEAPKNHGKTVGARGLISAGITGALALTLAMWKPTLRDKLIALGVGALVVGTILFPAVKMYLGGARLGIHMTAGAALILVIAGLLAHPGAANKTKKKLQAKILKAKGVGRG